MFKALLAVFLFGTIAIVQSSPIQNSVECQSCTMAVSMIQSYVMTNATEDEILNMLDTEVCQPLGALSSLCTEYLNAYVVKNFQTLVTMDPAAICGLVGMCPSTIPFPKLAIDCATCKESVQSVKTMLDEKALQDQILSYFQQFCPLLGSVAMECKLLVQMYLPTALKTIISEIDPEQVCEMVYVCPKSEHATATKVDHNVIQKSNSFTCTMCQTVVNRIEARIESNSTEAQIVQAVEKVCDHMPVNIKPMCVGFIDVYGQYFVELLVNQFSPKQICHTLKLC